MFFDQDIKGDRLPPGTLCLTYDDGPGETEGDGPGPHTTALGRFLHEQGVPATFFVIGRHAERHPETLRRLAAWGHRIGNHTYSHPGLVALAEAGGDVVGELVRTDALIRPYLARGPALFRAPYGNWRRKAAPDCTEDEPTSVVAAILNRSDRLRHYTGPVNWDICAEDWACWEQGVSPAEAAERYLREVERIGRGIVLLHNDSEDKAARARNQTLALTRLLVPALKQRGYRFDFVGRESLPDRSVLDGQGCPSHDQAVGRLAVMSKGTGAS